MGSACGWSGGHSGRKRSETVNNYTTVIVETIYTAQMVYNFTCYALQTVQLCHNRNSKTSERLHRVQCVTGKFTISGVSILLSPTRG